jgi:arylsulfatase A-like enzyme
MKPVFSLFTVIWILFSCSDGQTDKTSESLVTRDTHPNILIILTDDQGYADVTSFGATDLQTPNIDALVNDGMRLNNFYANCPVCSPTRAALLTGRYHDYVGVQGVIRTHQENSWGYLDTSAVLLPVPLNEIGYHTALIGKWHLGLESPNIPNERGFQFFHGFLGDMMDDYWTHRRFGNNYMYLNDSLIDPEGHATDLFSRWSVDYIRQRADSEQPWMLYLAYNAPHFPVQPPKEWLERVEQRESQISEIRANLIAFIEHMDDGIGQVIHALKETDQYENTLIIFTSDNGGHLPSEANNGPWRDGKQSVYEGGIRVPACVVWKGNIKEKSISNENLLTMDIFPTVLEAAGAKRTKPMEGKSFLHILTGQAETIGERPLFFTRREGNLRYRGQTIDAVRMGDWKLLQNNPFEPQELYNLKEDPYETNNLINKNRDKFKELNSLLMKHRQIRGAIPWQPPEMYYEMGE